MGKDEMAGLLERLKDQESRLRKLEARQAILDCSHRFCRGVNRRDRELLRSAFHPDAVDDHGFYCGGVDGFLDWIDTVYDRQAQTQHYVTNQTVELDSDNGVAHTEQYWFVMNMPKGGNEVILRGGRYIDRYEEREGHWAIARRVCFTEWNGTTDKLEFPGEVQVVLAESGVASQDKNDLSYMRPLEVQRLPTDSN